MAFSIRLERVLKWAKVQVKEVILTEIKVKKGLTLKKVEEEANQEQVALGKNQSKNQAKNQSKNLKVNIPIDHFRTHQLNLVLMEESAPET